MRSATFLEEVGEEGEVEEAEDLVMSDLEEREREGVRREVSFCRLDVIAIVVAEIFWGDLI